MQKKYFYLLVASATLIVSSWQQINPPEVIISNSNIIAKIYLPDSVTGYYRGGRFDWSGVMPELTTKDHSYFGKWFDEYNPERHDALMGPVEAFDPVGYDSARAGGQFVKIGIGTLIKSEEKAYSPFSTYRIVNHGAWKVKKEKDRISFQHTLHAGAYGYLYSKTISLIKGKARMEITHSLQNTGKETIETNAFNHNFFMLDKQTTGVATTISFPFALSLPGKEKSAAAALSERQIVFSRDMQPKESFIFNGIEGFGSSAADYDIRIENHHTGAGVRITADRPISKLVCWGIATTVCPEPYISMKIEPQQVFTWKINYDFYSCPITQ